jgi:hypothetical protein
MTPSESGGSGGTKLTLSKRYSAGCATTTNPERRASAAVVAVAEDVRMDLRTLLLGSRQTIAGTVYGSIVVLASLTAGAKPYEHDLWHLAAIVGTTVLVLWFAHVYSHGLGESLELGRRLTLNELGSIARRELSIPLSAVVPVALLALGALGVLENRTAVWLAFGAGVAALSVQGFRYALLERLSMMGTIVAVAFNIGLALIIVAAKVALAH